MFGARQTKHNQNKKNYKPCMYEMSCILLKFKNIKKKNICYTHFLRNRSANLQQAISKLNLINQIPQM